VNDPPVFEDAHVGDQRLNLFAREDRVRPEGSVLVDVLREDALRQDARRERDQLVGDGCPEHACGHGVDMPDAARSWPSPFHRAKSTFA
jgi:hypothetical protein